MPSVLPPFLSTGDPGSFAMRTIVERKPRIVAQVLESNRAVPSDVREGFEELVRDIREGVVASPIDGRDELCASFEPEELLAWEGEMACYAGRRWLDLPWFFAEAYFYLRLLVAWGYYDSSSPRGIGAGNHRLPLDPFQALKEQELCGPRGGLAVARQIAPSRCATIAPGAKVEMASGFVQTKSAGSTMGVALDPGVLNGFVRVATLMPLQA